LVPASEMFHIPVSIMIFHKPIENPLGQISRQLRENVFSLIHVSQLLEAKPNQFKSSRADEACNV
jgi:hypothetical protein